MSTQNVVSVRGGKVHKPSPYDLDHDRIWPACRTGGRNQWVSSWRFTEAAVDCQQCLQFIVLDS